MIASTSMTGVDADLAAAAQAGTIFSDSTHLLFYTALVVGICLVMLLLSGMLGERTRLTRAGREPFESGIIAAGGARYRMSAKYYLVAMFFVIFDLEAVYVFAWAVSARESGWYGYTEMVIFLVILLAALVYLWKLGALDWAPRKQKASDRRY